MSVRFETDRHHEDGQMFIETILLIVAFFSVVLVASNYFRSNAVIRSLVFGPWSYLQGMAENGAWAPPALAKKQHPNLRDRHATIRGDD